VNARLRIFSPCVDEGENHVERFKLSTNEYPSERNFREISGPFRCRERHVYATASEKLGATALVRPFLRNARRPCAIIIKWDLRVRDVTVIKIVDENRLVTSFTHAPNTGFFITINVIRSLNSSCL